MGLISKQVYEKLVFWVEEKWSMRKLWSDGKGFKNFYYTRYATNVPFQQSYRLSATMSDGKAYFSGNHKLCGYKVELSFLSTAFCTECSQHYFGSVSDLDIFCQNLISHKKGLKKVIKDFPIQDQELLGETSSDY